jgi:hypothetical protein
MNMSSAVDIGALTAEDFAPGPFFSRQSIRLNQ